MSRETLPTTTHNWPKRFECMMICDNCGRQDTYSIPIRNVIEVFDRPDDSPSCYHRRNDDEVTILPCNNCKLPTLLLLNWQDMNV